MKKLHYIIMATLLSLQLPPLQAELNQFGISNLIPQKSNDNATFDKRISEELLKGNAINFDGRRTTDFTIQDIVQFIQRIDTYFENYLNKPDNKNPEDLKLIKLAIIDVEKAEKMLKSNHVTPREEHVLRRAYNRLKIKLNAYLHTDNIESKSYLQ